MKKLFFILYLWPLAFFANTEEVVPPSTAESLLPKTENMPSYEGAFIKMLLTLGGLLALVFLTIWLLKKMTNGRFGSLGTQKKIHILEKKPLSPKTLLYLIEIDGKKALISESQLEVRTLLPLTEEEMYH